MQFDLANAFYKIELPVRPCKVLLFAHGGEARAWVTSVEGVPVDDTTPVFPQFRLCRWGGRTFLPASKTGEYDETVIIDNAALVLALLRLRAQRLPLSHLIGVPEVFWQAVHRAVALVEQVPCVLRHTGASMDVWAQRRSVTEIQARGRCEAAKPVRRWAKGGRVAHQMSACSEPLQRFARLCVAALPDTLVRLRPPSRPSALPHS